MRVAIVGAGWAGLAAAVAAGEAGAAVTVFEASRWLGGRARALRAERPDGQALVLDNGQHILIGAYRDTLALMRRLGVEPERALLALPLALPFPDGGGLQTPDFARHWPAPLDALAAMATARGWRWRDRLALLLAVADWRRTGFVRPEHWTVARMCARLPQRVMEELIEPLCVSALNLPTGRASATVFLNVMRDALFASGSSPAGWRGSTLLLPRADLSALLPEAATRWLEQPGSVHRLLTGRRVLGLQPEGGRWLLQGEHQGVVFSDWFDRVIWATPAGPAALAMAHASRGCAIDQPATSQGLGQWAHTAAALDHTAISTVYAWAPGLHLARPMLALRSAAGAPAQFVFDRGQLRPEAPELQGVLAFVVSASEGDRALLQQQVLQQAHDQLGLAGLQPIRTVVEKRATFACAPGLQRPACPIAPGLWAAGDYVEGPYPATLESAVRSGLRAAAAACA